MILVLTTLIFILIGFFVDFYEKNKKIYNQRLTVFKFLSKKQKNKIEKSINSCIFSSQIDVCHKMIDGCIKYWFEEGLEYKDCIDEYSYLRKKAELKRNKLSENE